MRRLVFLALACALLFAGCSVTARDAPKQAQEALEVSIPPLAQSAAPAPTLTPVQNPWAEEEVEAIARTLSGECYEDKPHDKRLVAEVILNRTSDGRWGNTVTEVVTAKSQFHGYWKPSRDISDNDREIATTALCDWYANDRQSLSDYLFFEAGPNRENIFRQTY